MSFRRFVCVLLVLVCLIPSMALAKSYSAKDIVEGKIASDDIVLKVGDKLTGSRGVTVEVSYTDMNDEVVDEGEGKIKSVAINGIECREWSIVGKSSSMSIGVSTSGPFYKSVYGFTVKPTYAIPDSEGYLTLSGDTYSVYTESDATGKKVKCAGRVTKADGSTLYLSVGEGMTVAVALPADGSGEIAVNDRALCKGEVTSYQEYEGVRVPLVTASELVRQRYEPLQEGDSGELVLQMKKRMQELGYFRAGAQLSDEYNDTCVERMMMFQKRNGLPETGRADEETLTLLYSDAAKSKE